MRNKYCLTHLAFQFEQVSVEIVNDEPSYGTRYEQRSRPSNPEQTTVPKLKPLLLPAGDSARNTKDDL